MEWLPLLNPVRQNAKKSTHEDIRSAFEVDFDRIIFSHPFRRLQDKTQVHPLPEYDFVHNRLTHSLEVSSVARSLGKMAGKTVIERNRSLQSKGFTHHDLGAIVAAAALAHDVGNPPFGHSGESGISDYFQSTELKEPVREIINDHQWKDLTTFEGNAQGFRILTHIGNGLKLTYPVLAAFTKYPCPSLKEPLAGRKSQKKYGFFQAEEEIFTDVAEQTGLKRMDSGAHGWHRHPLAFLVEAADDICYSIIDLEDGCGLGLVSYEHTESLLAAVIGDRFDREKLARIHGKAEKVAVLRAIAINRLVEETAEAFLSVEQQLLDGSFDRALVDEIPSADKLEEIGRISVQEIYRSKQVIEREAAGFEVLDGLMNAFVRAVYNERIKPESYTRRHKNILRLLPDTYQHQIKSSKSFYEALLVITDFISGMTDSNALNLYQIIKGIALPGLKK